MRILVTGGAGFIGCNFVRLVLELREAHAEALVLADGSRLINSPQNAAYTLARHDFDRALLAAGFAYTLTHRNVVSNIKAILTLLPLEAEQRALSFLPFSHIFERMGDADEHIAHYAVELDLKAAHEMFGLNYVAVYRAEFVPSILC